MIAKIVSCLTASLLTAAMTTSLVAMEKDEPQRKVEIPAAIMGKIAGQLSLKEILETGKSSKDLWHSREYWRESFQLRFPQANLDQVLKAGDPAKGFIPERNVMQMAVYLFRPQMILFGNEIVDDEVFMQQIDNTFEEGFAAVVKSRMYLLSGKMLLSTQYLEKAVKLKNLSAMRTYEYFIAEKVDIEKISGNYRSFSIYHYAILPESMKRKMISEKAWQNAAYYIDRITSLPFQILNNTSEENLYELFLSGSKDALETLTQKFNYPSFGYQVFLDQVFYGSITNSHWEEDWMPPVKTTNPWESSHVNVAPVVIKPNEHNDVYGSWADAPARKDDSRGQSTWKSPPTSPRRLEERLSPPRPRPVTPPSPVRSDSVSPRRYSAERVHTVVPQSPAPLPLIPVGIYESLDRNSYTDDSDQETIYVQVEMNYPMPPATPPTPPRFDDVSPRRSLERSPSRPATPPSPVRYDSQERLRYIRDQESKVMNINSEFGSDSSKSQN